MAYAGANAASITDSAAATAKTVNTHTHTHTDLLQENETLMAPLREFDVAIKPTTEPPRKLAENAAAAVSGVTPTRTGSDSTPSPPLPNPFNGGAASASTPPAAGDTPAAAGVTEQAAEALSVSVIDDGQKDGRIGEGEGGGGGGGGGGNLGEQPGLVALKGVSFRWTSGREEDQHAKIFRGLMKVDEKKRKVGGAVSFGWHWVRNY